MKTLKFALLSLTVASLAVPPNAYAACDKDGLLICGKGAAQIASADPLKVSRGGDFTPLASGSDLKGGDRVLVGSSKATLALGATCKTSVGAASTVLILRSDDKTCASVASQDSADMRADITPPDRPLLGGITTTQAVVGLGLLGAAGGGLALALSNKSGTVSHQ